MIQGKKGISYEEPPPATTFIRSEAMYDEFMEKLYQITGYDRQNTHLRVTAVPHFEGVYNITDN